MHIIKLDAIDSTNSYLRQLLKEEALANLTVVVAEEQLQGRGQRGTMWLSEPHKNLTFSVLIKPFALKASNQFYLSMCVSLALSVAVKKYVKSDIWIKWPNDILAGKDKIAGILIENMLYDSKIKNSIVGIGLNVNQRVFPQSLKQVTSLKLASDRTIDRTILLSLIIEELKKNLLLLDSQSYDELKSAYLKRLYKFEQPAMFERKNNTVFLGKIVGISKEGYLIIELDNGTTEQFALKEIKFAQ